MLPIVVQLNFFLALGTILLQVAAVVLAVVIVRVWSTRQTNPISALVSRFAMPATFFFALGTSAVTLLYSEVFGFIPCGLCWFERIALYPQVVIAAIAFYMKDRVFAPVYLIALSLIGAVIALYHHYLQMGGPEMVACPATTVSCAQRILFEFNYITYPLMAFSLFVVIALMFVLKAVHTRAGTSLPA